KNATKFIKEGNKVKVSLRMRGRQMVYVSEGIAVMAKFSDFLKDVAVVEKQPVAEGRYINMVMGPIGTKNATPNNNKQSNGGNKDA
ncbi:MAG: translation initiation factor IF-3 C-terminal domain-containing protein, partial [Clostridia bacterium]|nr:translation initiation factor IF-3 C-terminal domain-containing protein [Clostridia bacterium]